MIAQERSKAAHLLLALPAAAYVTAFLIVCFGGGAEDSVATFLLVPILALVPALYVLPIALLVGVPAYFALRRKNQLRLSWFLALGIVPGLLVGLLALFKVHSLLFASAFAVFGALSGAVAYGTLSLLANRKSASV